MCNIENLKNLLEVVFYSFSIIGIIFGIFFMKYRYSSDIRDRLGNAYDIYNEIFAGINIKWSIDFYAVTKTVVMMKQARIFFPKEILDFAAKVKDNCCILYGACNALKNDSKNPNVDEYKKRKECSIKELNKLSEQCPHLFRKYIIGEGLFNKSRKFFAKWFYLGR